MDQRITLLENHVKADLCRLWTLDELATAAEISRSQLAKLCQTELGISPVRFVRELRLKKACELLETTFLLVKETMSAVGINDQSHFVRDFKKRFGVSPKEYRRLHYEKTPAESFVAKSEDSPTNRKIRQ